MSESQQPRPNPVAFRLEAEILRRLDNYAEYLTRPGLRVTRTDAIRSLILSALAEDGSPRWDDSAHR